MTTGVLPSIPSTLALAPPLPSSCAANNHQQWEGGIHPALWSGKDWGTSARWPQSPQALCCSLFQLGRKRLRVRPGEQPCARHPHGHLDRAQRPAAGESSLWSCGKGLGKLHFLGLPPGQLLSFAPYSPINFAVQHLGESCFFIPSILLIKGKCF